MTEWDVEKLLRASMREGRDVKDVKEERLPDGRLVVVGSSADEAVVLMTSPTGEPGTWTVVRGGLPDLPPVSQPRAWEGIDAS